MPGQTNQIQVRGQAQPPRVGGEQDTPDGLGSSLVKQKGHKGAQSAGDEFDMFSVGVPVDKIYLEVIRKYFFADLNISAEIKEQLPIEAVKEAMLKVEPGRLLVSSMRVAAARRMDSKQTLEDRMPSVQRSYRG